MSESGLSDSEFIEKFMALGATGMARQFNVSERNIYARRARISNQLGQFIPAPRDVLKAGNNPERIKIEVKDGSVLIGSDFHIWPGSNGPALRAFKKFINDIRPAAVILNGDVLDFPRISRHPPIGWEKTPSPQEEIEAAQDHLHDIAKAARKAHKVWTLGNHDARFEVKLASVAPEFARVHGIHLKDHFPLYQPCWSVWINDDVVVKHRFKGGIHATHNNTLWSGKSIVTGHLHSQKVTPFTDYNGDRYGVDTGCVADPRHRAFVGYTEDNPLNWRSGFVELSFRDGRLLHPQLIGVWDADHVQYKGEIHKV